MLTNDQLLHFYGRMVTIRAFEEKLSELFTTGLLGGTSHFCIGQEASAVGVVGASRATDWLVSNHRGHGHLLARGLDVSRVMAELLGRLTGYCGGRGGSQHLCSYSEHFLGTNGIVGGGLPIATGAAFALKYQKSSDIAIVFFGDGASNQGTFHESLNLAQLWQLPVLFVCENNFYGMSTPISKTIARADGASFEVPSGTSGVTGWVTPRAAAYGIRGTTADGRDVEAVYAAAEAAIGRIRAGEGPELLELMTYRLCGHSKSEPRVYRTREEEETMREHDGLAMLPARLAERGVPGETIEATAAAARAAVEEATQRALAAPYGGRVDALGGVFEEMRQ